MTVRIIIFVLFLKHGSRDVLAQSPDTLKSEVVYLHAFFQTTDSIYACYKVIPRVLELRDSQYVHDYNMEFRSYEVNFQGEKNTNAGEPVFLTGSVTWFDHNTVVREQFANGFIKTLERVDLYDSDTAMYFYFNFDSLYNEQPGSYFVKVTHPGYTRIGFFREDEKDWWDFYSNYDSRGDEYVTPKYPYFKGIVPSFIGVVAGLEGFRSDGYELGVAWNVGELSGDIYGGMGGLILTYKNRFDQSYHSINAEVGAYAPISFGMGYHYNSNGTDDTHSFRLFTGITLFHLQMLYGYNFYKNSKNEIPELFHHTFTLRYVLPVWRIP